MGGFVVVGETAVQYASPSGTSVTTAVDRSTFGCYGCVDPQGARYLLGKIPSRSGWRVIATVATASVFNVAAVLFVVVAGDARGGVSLLVLESEHNTVTGIQMERLGSASVASSLTYLDDGVVYLGSERGDPQV